MSRPRALTPEQAQKVVALYSGGMLQLKIAAELGTTLSVVQRVASGRAYADVTGMKRGGRPVGRRRALSPAQALAARADIELGVPRPQIAKGLGVTVGVINKLATGQGYSDVTGIHPRGAACTCEDCEKGRAPARNLKLAAALRSVFECPRCHAKVRRTVAAVEKSDGVVHCKRCEKGLA